MRSVTSRVSSTVCFSAASMFRMEATKSAILPGSSIFTMLSRISSENSGLFSETCFISEISARVNARTSSDSMLLSSRYSTAAARGVSKDSTLAIRKRFRVDRKMLIPPSGRLILRTILAAVPTVYRSAASRRPLASWRGSESAPLRSITRPTQPSPSSAARATRSSRPSGIIMGVKTPGNIGLFESGSRTSFGGRTVSAGMICRCSITLNLVACAARSQACAGVRHGSCTGLMRACHTGKLLACRRIGVRRNSIESAVVLQAARMGEIHRRVTLFTGERGVVYATAHGAGKAVSKLKAAAIPFACITAYLYHDPVRNTFKVTDVEARNVHPAIRADLRKFFTASLWVEIVLRSHGGGTHAGDLFALLVEALHRLDGAAGGKWASCRRRCCGARCCTWASAPTCDAATPAAAPCASTRICAWPRTAEAGAGTAPRRAAQAACRPPHCASTRPRGAFCSPPAACRSLRRERTRSRAPTSCAGHYSNWFSTGSSGR